MSWQPFRVIEAPELELVPDRSPNSPPELIKWQTNSATISPAMIESDSTERLVAADTSTDTVSSAAESTETEIALPPNLNRSQRVMHNSGLSLLDSESVEPDTDSEREFSDGQSPLTASIHATRLRDIARESLRNSKHRLERGASYSAKKYAMEAMRSIVAMRDARTGGNQHAKQLEVALDAIRESKDFCGQFGVIDEHALKRMVVAHETTVLKDNDFEHISVLEATQAYLAVANTNLVLAARDVQEASDALVLLGQIEQQMSQPGDIHAAAVAVTLQRAAVEISPANAFAYRELGATLLNHGLVEQAAWALNRSIEIQPTRIGYERLLDASRQLGNDDTARACLAALQHPELQSEIPVQTLSPRAFAATNRPNAALIKPVNAKPATTTDSETRKAAEPKISLRSLFPFSRR